jgi:hypothetical protein
MPQMIIASRLVDGVVVFFDAANGWVDSIAAGTLIEDAADADELLASAKRDEADNVVVDPYLIDVAVEGGMRRPSSNREAIRAFGPTIRTELIDSHEG